MDFTQLRPLSRVYHPLFDQTHTQWPIEVVRQMSASFSDLSMKERHQSFDQPLNKPNTQTFVSKPHQAMPMAVPIVPILMEAQPEFFWIRFPPRNGCPRKELLSVCLNGLPTEFFRICLPPRGKCPRKGLSLTEQNVSPSQLSTIWPERREKTLAVWRTPHLIPSHDQRKERLCSSPMRTQRMIVMCLTHSHGIH